MYMPDAIRATIELMEPPAKKIKIRSSYNISGISFSPKEIASVLKNHFSNFRISYKLDYRQKIADSWPESIDEKHAKRDWGWNAEYNLEKMALDMILNLKKSYKQIV